MEKVITLDASIRFIFDEYNPRRDFRGVEAARVYVSYDNEQYWEWLWMSEKDIRKNIMTYGRHQELIKALDAYKKGDWVKGGFELAMQAEAERVLI